MRRNHLGKVGMAWLPIPVTEVRTTNESSSAERWESNPIISYSAVSPIGTPSSMESIIRFRVPLLPAPTPVGGLPLSIILQTTVVGLEPTRLKATGVKVLYVYPIPSHRYNLFLFTSSTI